MSFTSLALGTNWPKDEWPEHVNVMHEGVGDSRRYVPKRTTRLELVATEVDKNGDALAVGVHCALCGLLDEEVVGADPDNWMLWRYCPSCGAEVVS